MTDLSLSTRCAALEARVELLEGLLDVTRTDVHQLTEKVEAQATATITLAAILPRIEEAVKANTDALLEIKLSSALMRQRLGWIVGGAMLVASAAGNGLLELAKALIMR